MVEAPLKTKDSYRTLSIRADVVGILREQKRKTNSDYVLSVPAGGPISPDSVLNIHHWCIATELISRTAKAET